MDEAVERRLTQRVFENVVDAYLSELEKRKVEEAKKVAAKLEAAKQRETKAKEALGEPEVKPPETPEEFEEAAEALRREAERRKTEEQKADVYGWAKWEELHEPTPSSSRRFPAYWAYLRELHQMDELLNL